MTDPVIFLMPDGSEVSNDPSFGFQRQAEDAASSREAELRAEIEAELRAKIEAERRGEAEDADADDDNDEFSNLGGKELKELAEERGVDISGLKKVGEVREALRAAARGN